MAKGKKDVGKMVAAQAKGKKPQSAKSIDTGSTGAGVDKRMTKQKSWLPSN